MALCPKCNKQELQSGETECPHCRNKSRGGLFKFLGGAALAVGTAAVLAAPMIVSAVINKNKNNRT